MTFGMFLRQGRTALAVCALALVTGSAKAAGGGDFGVPKPPDPPEGFDALRKPPIPVSFLAHDGGWIQFQYPPSARDRVAPLIAQADDQRAELAEYLAQTPLDGIELRVARGFEEMTTLAPQGAPPLPQATAASYPSLKLIVISLGPAGAGELVDLRDGMRREVARLGLVEAIAGRAMPAWFAEGFGRYFSHETEWSREWALYRASVRHAMHSASDLDAALVKGGSEAELASAESADFVGFLLTPERRPQFALAVERLRRGDDFDTAVASSYGTALSTLERRWRADRTRLTTLTTVSAAIGVPAVIFIGFAALRFLRRRRQRAIAGLLESKKVERTSTAPDDSGRVHIVLSRRDERNEIPVIAEPEIPKVEHEGEWHTLH